MVSFRLTIGRPRFARAHNHKYTFGPLSQGRLRPIAELPAQLAWSRLRHVATEGLYRFSASRVDMRPGRHSPQPAPRPAPPSFEPAIRDDQLAPGQIRPLSAKLCVAKLENGQVVAFGRRCPHLGGDLAFGTLRDGKVLCPLHNLPVDPLSGQSPCRSLRAVETCPVERTGDVWRVQREVKEPIAAST